MMATTIQVAERGVTEVSKGLWQSLSASEAFWALVERGILSVKHASRRSVQLLGGCYVGRAQIATDIILDLHEKVEGSLVSLMLHAARGDFRLEKNSSPDRKSGVAGK